MEAEKGLAEMLKGGVIMDMTTAEQAQIAETAKYGSKVGKDLGKVTLSPDPRHSPTPRLHVMKP